MTTLTKQEAARLLGCTPGMINRHEAAGRLARCTGIPPKGVGRPPVLYPRSQVERLKELLAEKAEAAAARRAQCRNDRTANYLTVEERQEPAVLYGLLTASDLRELERRRAKVAA